jgi:predicted acetyltransferase
MKGRLVSLEAHHGDALESFLLEFDSTPEDLHGYFCGRDWTIDRAAVALAAWSRGEDMQEGWVPCSTWFWEADGALQGVINVRHHLSPGLEQVGGNIGYSVAPSHRRKGVATAMLAAVLEPCRHLGIHRALLTCDSDNPASSRTIERNGGVMDREGWVESEQRMQRWYWIDLSD